VEQIRKLQNQSSIDYSSENWNSKEKMDFKNGKYNLENATRQMKSDPNEYDMTERIRKNASASSSNEDGF